MIHFGTYELTYILTNLHTYEHTYEQVAFEKVILHQNFINKKGSKWYKYMFQIFFSGPKS